MGKQKGDGFILWIFEEDGATKAAIPTEISTDLEFGNSLIDSTDKSSGGAEESEDGTRNWTASAECRFDKTDDVQYDLITRILNPQLDTKKKIAIGEDTETGDILFTGEARIESISVSAPTGDLMSSNLSFKGVGLLVPTKKSA